MRLFLALALVASPLTAQEPLEQAVTAILDEAGPGTRWGVVVADDQGREVLAIDPEGRFIPASNTKVFTTAAAMRALAMGGLTEPAGARVRLEPDGQGHDVALEGHGDAHLSSAAGCITDCLSTLADAVAARTRRVGDVIGDDTKFPDQRWSPGMSWNNIATRSGTGISALTVDANEIASTVTPGTVGAAPAVTLPAYYTVRNLALTVEGDGAEIGYDRAPGGRELVVTGTIGVSAKPVALTLGVDDPAHYAAWTLAEMLRARGVAVTGEVAARHRTLLPADDPKARGTAPVMRPARLPALAELTAPPPGPTLAKINKDSQNLYAELVLRRLGCLRGNCSIADGQAEISAMLAEAGVGPREVSLSDGSGMSTYNRVAPRGMVRLLGWIARQPWGGDFRAMLPVGGVDGTLSRRFAGTPLAGKVLAKTGSLNATNALAGYLTAASGRTLTFAIYANDVPEDVRATAIMDRALVAIAAAN